MIFFSVLITGCQLFIFRAYLGLHLRNRVFKSKRTFGQKLHFYVFAKRAFWPFLDFVDP
jgi:hypothetical protein